MRVLVTGAAGFVGSRVASAFVSAGHEVVALVRKPGPRLDGLASSLRIERCDLTDVARVRSFVESSTPELCVHCAWFAVPGSYTHAPENDVHRVATLRLAEALAAAGCERLVGIGTCFEYAQSDKPLSEPSEVDPSTPYAVSKLSAYRELSSLSAKTDMSFAWARLFYLYGPFEDPRRLVPSVIRSLIGGQPARTTAGEQVRDFLHVDDVAAALVAVAGADISGAVNVGSGQAVSVREIVLALGTLVGRPELVELGALPYAPGDPMVVVADNELLVTRCDWAPQISLQRGLSDVVDWWKAQLAR